MARRKRSRALASPAEDHIEAATRLVHEAWVDLERMPPTCSGGIALASRAYANVREAQAHLQSVSDRKIREENSELYGLANQGGRAALETLNFFKHTCKAPHGEARERPLYSRAKLKRRR